MARLLLVTVALALFLGARSASACGALIAFTEERPGGISDQQVLIASGKTGSVLIVSVGFRDAAKEFGFLLPLQRAPKGVYDGEVKLFERLEERMAPRIHIVDATRAPSSGGGGCGCLGAKAPPGAAGLFGESEVMVVERGETTTYEYVVLGGTSGSGVQEWLERERFQVPRPLAGEIDRYLASGWLFLAAKLKPTHSTGALAPIEVHFDGLGPGNLEYPFALSAQ